MVLPEEIRQKLAKLFDGQNKKTLIETRQEITHKYKTNQAINKSIFDKEQDSVVYAISRMPATFGVLYNLLSDLLDQGVISDVRSIIDIGSGTGAGYFASKEIFGNIEIFLFERDKHMIDVFNKFDTGKEVSRFDFLKDNIAPKADLVMTNYVFSELNEEGRKLALEKMINASNKYVLIVDTGTPRTYENFMRLKKYVADLGCKVTAPCKHEKCGLKNDYCQFYARIERSSLMKLSKNASLPYEDEKYFYLLIDKQVKNDSKEDLGRVIYRPKITTNFVDLKICTRDGVVQKNITKKDKEVYKKARKINVNELI